jgi:hypothetical protein
VRHAAYAQAFAVSLSYLEKRLVSSSETLYSTGVKSTSYKKGLLQDLRDPVFVSEYLKQAAALGPKALQVARREVLESLPVIRLATITTRGKINPAEMEEDRLQLETRLREGLDQCCLVTVKGTGFTLDLQVI